MGALAVSRPLTTMTSTTNGNTILHRSSRRINRPALSVPVSSVDSEKSATAHTHIPSTPLSFFCFHYISIPQTVQSNHALAPPQKPDTASNVSAARSSIRSAASKLYFPRPRAGLALHRQVGETVESLAPASPVSDAPYTLPPGMKVNNGSIGWHLHHQTTSESSCPADKVNRPRAPVRVPKEKPTSRCPVGKAGNWMTPVRVPQGKLLSRFGKPGSITLPHVSDTVTSSYMSQPSSSSSFVTSSHSYHTHFQIKPCTSL